MSRPCNDYSASPPCAWLTRLSAPARAAPDAQHPVDQITTQLRVDAAKIFCCSHARSDTRIRRWARLPPKTISALVSAWKATLDRRVGTPDHPHPDLRSARRIYYVPHLFGAEGFISTYYYRSSLKGRLRACEVLHRAPRTQCQWLDFLENLAVQTAIAIDNAELFNQAASSNAELMQAYDATIEGWSRAYRLARQRNRRAYAARDRMALRAQAIGRR